MRQRIGADINRIAALAAWLRIGPAPLVGAVLVPFAYATAFVLTGDAVGPGLAIELAALAAFGGVAPLVAAAPPGGAVGRAAPPPLAFALAAFAGLVIATRLSPGGIVVFAMTYLLADRLRREPPAAAARGGAAAASFVRDSGCIATALDPALAGHYRGRSVLVSGAGGSIGAELCRQLLACAPQTLVLFELCEHALFEIERELAARPGAVATRIVPVLGSVAEARLVRSVLAAHAVDVVLHAAAYKHVPLVERNVLSGLANNVLATEILAREAQAAEVGRFVLVSSDKAVRPVGAMGATKRIAELIVQDLASRSGSGKERATRFASVRFGNVFGSSGSVVPVFRAQIAAGGPVTLTDARATRYFMSTGAAVHLVLRAGASAAGGETFVLDMGEPVRIADLARQLIAEAGQRLRQVGEPGDGIEIREIGLRPGERLHEAPMTDGARPSGVHPSIQRIEPPGLPEFALAALIRSIRSAVALGDDAEARRIVDRFLVEDPSAELSVTAKAAAR